MRIILLLITILAVMVLGFSAQAQQQMSDKQFANALWSALAEAQMVGENSIQTRPYEGTEPHGAILEFLEDQVSVAGSQGRAIVKKNFGGEDVSVERVWADGREYLMAVTVMFQRESGYDPEHDNWFWVKYAPDGSVKAAGKVQGCISCHSSAPGNDYIYSYNRQ